MSGEVYLDYAATSALRPPEVADAVYAFLTDVGATPGRSGHRRALAASRLALRCRVALARLFGVAGDPGRIAFQPNATYALNTALAGLLRPGDRVVRTAFDHNAVRRPLATLAGRGVEVSVLGGRADGSVDVAEAEQMLGGAGRPARVLVMPHVSNVLGTALPVAELAARAHAVGAVVVLDAAQSAGHLPLDVGALGVDVLAFTGHKGLLGPQGTGGVWVRPGLELPPFASGGTGGASDDAEMPLLMPDRHEAGTQNAPGIAGLLAGVDWLLEHGVEQLHRREVTLKARLRAGLAALPGVRVHSPSAPEGTGIVLVTTPTMGAAELAMRLDREHGVATRAGLHCAPEAHAVVGTLEQGAVRLSLGWASTPADVVRAVEAVAALCGGAGAG